MIHNTYNLFNRTLEDFIRKLENVTVAWKYFSFYADCKYLLGEVHIKFPLVSVNTYIFNGNNCLNTQLHTISYELESDVWYVYDNKMNENDNAAHERKLTRIEEDVAIRLC